MGSGGRPGRATGWVKDSASKLGGFLVRGAPGWCPESAAGRHPLGDNGESTDFEARYLQF